MVTPRPKRISPFQAAVYERLVACARAGQVIDYSSLCGSRWAAQASGRALVAIGQDEHAAGRALITAIAIGKKTRLPGTGFFSWIVAHDAGLTRCPCGSQLRRAGEHDRALVRRHQADVFDTWASR